MKTNIGNSDASSPGRGFIPSIRRHASEIKEGGWPLLLRKIRTFLRRPWHVLLSIIMVPIWLAILIVRALRPLVLIRFGHLRSESIGHFGGDTEMYLCRRDAGMDDQRAVDIFYHHGPACNQQLKKMWERTLRVSSLARPFDFVNRTLPGGRKHMISHPPRGYRDIHRLLPRTPVHLSFTTEEERLGREGLKAMGISEGAPFICFHVRDSAYHENTTPDRDFSFSDYRDTGIQNHVPAAEEMTHLGYFTVRMGAVVKKPLQTANPMIIDYATRYRNDFMDIFLCAKCYFYFGSSAGLAMIPSIFRKPIANVNVVPIQAVRTWGQDDLFIPKKLWLREERRFMTFREIFDRRIDNIRIGKHYEQLGIESVENTPEEITALVVEMDERLKGIWQTTKEDEELQRRFWSIFKPNKILHGVIVSHIGAEFLRQNQELLD